MSERTYSMRELSRATGVAPRTIRTWIAARLLAPAARRGPHTRYSHDQWIRVRAIAYLRAQNARHDEIRVRVTMASLAAVEALLPEPPVKLPAAPPPPPPEPTYPTARWERVTLMPGLEIHIDTTGGAILRQVAQAIYNHYALRPPAR